MMPLELIEQNFHGFRQVRQIVDEIGWKNVKINHNIIVMQYGQPAYFMSVMFDLTDEDFDEPEADESAVEDDIINDDNHDFSDGGEKQGVSSKVRKKG
jgi:hypothetical protein